MNLKRIRILFAARNREFLRDRAGFGWNILFPFLIVAGFGIIFSGDTRTEYKAGVFPAETGEIRENAGIPEQFKTFRYIRFLRFPDFETGIDKLRHHKIDILIRIDQEPSPYWINDSSPSGYITEKMLIASLMPDREIRKKLVKKEIQGRPIRYIDWLFPGILGMNMMFSAMYGVGYVIVRYRRNGVLKRLMATPVTAFEYLLSQLLSRVIILFLTACIVWIGSDLIFDFRMAGSYLDAAAVFLIGAVSLVSLGLIIACRGTSEEFASGMINFICWPMMFLSGVWFSMEGSPQWVQMISKVFPLTHILAAVRRIINDGAAFSEVLPEVAILSFMSIVFLSAGAFLFSWTR